MITKHKFQYIWFLATTSIEHSVFIIDLDKEYWYYGRGSIIGGRAFRKPPYFVPSKPQTAFVFL